MISVTKTVVIKYDILTLLHRYGNSRSVARRVCPRQRHLVVGTLTRRSEAIYHIIHKRRSGCRWFRQIRQTLCFMPTSSSHLTTPSRESLLEHFHPRVVLNQSQISIRSTKSVLQRLDVEHNQYLLHHKTDLLLPIEKPPKMSSVSPVVSTTVPTSQYYSCSSSRGGHRTDSRLLEVTWSTDPVLARCEEHGTAWINEDDLAQLKENRFIRRVRLVSFVATVDLGFSLP